MQYYTFKNGPVGDGHLTRGVVRAHPAGARFARHQMLDLAVQRRPAARRAAPLVGIYDDRLSAAPGEPRSQIELRSADPADPPAVYPNYLATETDQQTIVDGLKLLPPGRWRTPQMQRLITAEFQPGPEVAATSELLDYARQRGGTVYHPTSTCKMGTDTMAVVDPELRVHGHRRLARRRRLDHADRGFRQHQRRNDHDRRARRRHGPSTDEARSLVNGRSDPHRERGADWLRKGQAGSPVQSAEGYRPVGLRSGLLPNGVLGVESLNCPLTEWANQLSSKDNASHTVGAADGRR